MRISNLYTITKMFWLGNEWFNTVNPSREHTQVLTFCNTHFVYSKMVAYHNVTPVSKLSTIKGTIWLCLKTFHGNIMPNNNFLHPFTKAFNRVICRPILWGATGTIEFLALQ